MQHAGAKRRRVVSEQPSRDYCRTCRKRRVKCDATRPACRRCTQSGRRCEGYAIWTVAVPTRGAAQKLLITGSGGDDGDDGDSKSATSSTAGSGDFSSKTCSPIILPLAEPVRRSAYTTDSATHFAFEYFIRVGMPVQVDLSAQPSTAHATISWCIVQSAYHPMWLHLLAALGSGRQAVLPYMHTSFTQPLDLPKYDAALQMYHQGLRESQSFRDRPRELTMIEPLICALMLLFGFEMAVGNQMSFLRSLRYVRALFRAYPEWCAQLAAKGSIISMVKLALPSGITDPKPGHILDMTRNVPADMNTRMAKLLDESGPPKLRNSEEAKLYLECLLDSARQIEVGVQRCAQARLRNIPGNKTLSMALRGAIQHCMGRIVPLDPLLLAKIQRTLDGYVSWRAAYEALVRSQPELANDEEMLFLLIRCFATRLAVATCRETREESYDRFTREFIDALQIIERYFKVHTRPGSSTFGPQPHPPRYERTGSHEWGVLRALFNICVKSRDPALRRRARRMLMEARRMESNVLSETWGQYAQAVIDLEELQSGGLSNEALVLPGLFANSIPEAARISDVIAINGPQPPQVFTLGCARFLHDKDDRIEAREYTFRVMTVITPDGTHVLHPEMSSEDGRVEVPVNELSAVEHRSR